MIDGSSRKSLDVCKCRCALLVERGKDDLNVFARRLKQAIPELAECDDDGNSLLLDGI